MATLTRDMELSKNLSLSLVNDVEFYLDQEFDRILTNNGRMSSFAREQRVREIAAEAIAPEHAVMMIESDGFEGSIESWNVQSFLDDSVAYAIKVSSATNQILSYTCFDFQRRRQPCKHMYLLDLHVNGLILNTFSTNHSINTTVGEGHDREYAAEEHQRPTEESSEEALS